MLKALYDNFLQERRFLKNCSPKTLRSYGQAWDAFESVLVQVEEADAVRPALKNGVVQLMDSGRLKPSSINVYLRAMNAFLRWASVEEHLKPPVSGIPLLKAPVKVISTLNEAQVHQLAQFKPRFRKERRVHAMALLVLDTGLRLNECLQLEVKDVDLENFLVTVQKGKGNRQRRVPISGTGRKVLYRHICNGGNPARRFVFETANSTAVTQRNADRDLKYIGRKLRLDLHWHLLRHTFGTLFIRNGGNVADLQRIMGHRAITTTMLYVHSQASDFVMAHNTLSPLAKANR
ncbi:site-specific integrase [uncultured Paludibaculum sp.]|uniref:tyrosine-type recombinase/integrase n=1 Tax=uncultured Paludibaculum sp. TaxID=1765020 RepID=UPI002AAB8AEC|nr:site-specific integrase [uncultured Paludibaculum sp.]